MRLVSSKRFRWQSVADILAALALVVSTAAVTAAEDAKSSRPTTKTPEAKSPQAAPAPAKADPFVVPNGSPEELLKYLEGLGQLEPSGHDPASLAQFAKKMSAAVLQATDMVLASKPTEHQAAEAAQWKLEGLLLAERGGDTEANAKRKALPAELEKLGWKQLARTAQGIILGEEVSRFAGDNKGFRDLLKRIEAYLAQGSVGRREVSLMMDVAMAAEQSRPDVAPEAYQVFAKILAANPDKETAALGAKLEGAARRLRLVGKPMVLAGQSLDGKPLDWSKYRGKVVLVAFWATWCGPCREELKSIREQYAAFHDKGLEVISVSVDKSREALVEFIQDTPVPWTVLADQALHSSQADKSMGTFYGVFSIPQLIVVDRDGNVAATNVRGPRLRELIESLLGKTKS